ncbi:MAG: prepilin-type N-terminal cleavage/methylation domain-containing protein [Calditrichota bacterium]
MLSEHVKHLRDILLKKVRSSQGYTLIEIILVIVMTGLIATIFSEVLVSSIQIYTQQNMRKSSHIDARRTYDMLAHDIHEWDAWNGGQTSSRIDFNKASILQNPNNMKMYYDSLRIGYQFTGSNLTYQRNDDGLFNNQYSLLTNSVPGQSSYQVLTQGGKNLVQINVLLTVQGQPMRMRTYVFPRKQGG